MILKAWNTTTKCTAAALLLCASSTNVQAFDDQRKGFQIGIGIGAHSSSLDVASGDQSSSIESDQQLASSIQLGYGFTNRLSAFIGGKGGAVVIEDIDATMSFGGIGGTFYLSESSPSIYVTGLIGNGALTLDNKEKSESKGDGWLVGVGYELTNHLQFELSYGRAELADELLPNNTSKLESTFATVQYTFY